MNSKRVEMKPEWFQEVEVKPDPPTELRMEARVSVGRAKVREMQFQVSRLLGRNASAGNTGKAFLRPVEVSVLEEVWAMLKEMGG